MRVIQKALTFDDVLLQPAHLPGDADHDFHDPSVLDALTRHMGLPLVKFFGGTGAELETDMTVTTGTAADNIRFGRDDADNAILEQAARMAEIDQSVGRYDELCSALATGSPARR